MSRTCWIQKPRSAPRVRIVVLHGRHWPRSAPSCRTLQQPVSASANYSSLAYPTTTLDQGFTPIAVPAGCTTAGLQNGAANCYKGAIIYSWDKKVQPAHSSQWSLFVEHEFSPSAIVQIGYVGQMTKHLTNAELLSQRVCGISRRDQAHRRYASRTTRSTLTRLAYIFGTFSEAHQDYHACCRLSEVHRAA